MRRSEDPMCDTNDVHSVEKTLGMEKKNSLHIFGTHREQSDSKKKRVQCRALQADGQYKKEIFRKMKDFYKNNEDTSLGCDGSPDRDFNLFRENPSGENPSDEKMRGEEVKAKNGSADEEQEENIAKPFNKRRKTLLHEVAYASSESNSKSKREVGRRTDGTEPIGCDHIERDNRRLSPEDVNLGEHTPTDNLVQREDKTDGTKGAIELDMIDTHPAVNRRSDASPPPNEHSDEEGNKGENELNGGCTVEEDRKNAQISFDGKITAHYGNDKDALCHMHCNGLEVGSERKGKDHTSARKRRRSSVTSDKKNGKNDSATVDSYDIQRENIPNKRMRYAGEDNASIDTAICEEQMNDKTQSIQKRGSKIGDANGRSEATFRKALKHVFSGNNSIVKNSIVEKKKKIKSIHNEILSLISADSLTRKGELMNCGVNSVGTTDLSLDEGGEREKQVHTGVNEREGNGGDPQVDNHTGTFAEYQLVSPSEERLILEEYRSVCCDEWGSLKKEVHQMEYENDSRVQRGVEIYNKMDTSMEESRKGHRSTHGSQNCPLETSSLYNAELVEKGPNCVMIPQKGDIYKERLPREGRIPCKPQPRSSLLKKVKLMYEREKKTLEINRKYLNKYGYFKIIMNTYTRNDLLNMNEHGVDFDLSRILFSHDIIKKINQVNFKTVIKALDFYGYLYDNTFLKRLSNKVSINEWLCNGIFFQKIFTRKVLNVGIFFDLVYHFLYLNPAFIDFFFSKNGGSFVKKFSLYDKYKALRLVNNIVAQLKIIRPSTESVVKFLFGFFSSTKGGEEAIRRGRKKALYRGQLGNKDHSADVTVGNVAVQDATVAAWTAPINQSKHLVRKPKGWKENAHVYIKNTKFKKTGLRNILNKIWEKTDLYVKEEVYYGNNFTVRRRLRENKSYHLKMLNNLLFESNDTTSSRGSYSFGGDQEEGGLGYSFEKSGEINFGINEKMSQSFHQNRYHQGSGADGGDNSDDGDNIDGADHVDAVDNEDGGDNVDGGDNAIACDERRATKTFHSLDCVPNVSFDLFSHEGDSFQR
ncbi:hypothetical protein AK88_02356 [Plasmodium fragile]|uniref:Uncharacterized protein n=1 Tax=Plasmodium fragile TaxID=5857 RepID=A0A0D9QM99_PLAFR|nr:uncharacterized protein AK88_02356 [Plasmodium fragile]KJP87922.1 hypothetical protein AK88_02356 [Plasmodium fragile]